MVAALDSAAPNRISRFLVPVLPLVPETSETMRFARTPTAPMLSMTELAALIPNLDAPEQPRVSPVSARTVFGVVVVSLVAVIGALAYARSATTQRRAPEVLSGGDIRRPVELRAPTDSLALVRRDTTRPATPAAAVAVAPPTNSRRTPSALPGDEPTPVAHWHAAAGPDRRVRRPAKDHGSD